ncbi:helix-turn-helix domain-containing protein [Sutcliffiella horikoshii]|uniref:CdaR family transcriptional regulator n=1 Tax=Sutcliffiella horikoshii TaxID=79883 RepID=UPI00203D3C24|nr:sugar diacid recognition domain-containing protein [Sutcliffiella horikoshii]MCM3618658.1 helix-turn-helix domain-containing protein [Sutcliffiella horikoshii]
MLRTSLAKKIIREVKNFIEEDLIMVDTSGTIIASTDPDRLGNYHEGAFLAASEKQMRIISKQDESILTGVKAGINLPLFHQHKVVGVIGITGTPENVLPYGELIKKMTELLIQENHYQDQFEWEARSLETFVFDWLLKDGPSTSIKKRAELLGINMDVNRQVILIEFQTDEVLMKTKTWHFSELNLELKDEDILVQWGQNRMILLLTSNESLTREALFTFLKNIQNQLQGYIGTKVFMGIGNSGSFSSLKDSYTEAERALNACTMDGTLIFEEDLRLEMILQAIPVKVKKEFAQRLLTPILAEKELLDTIQMYFTHHLSLKETAQAMHIHINTLHYRLRKVENLAGLELKKPRDLTTLYLACALLEDSTIIIQ